jgi:hypothetical protein
VYVHDEGGDLITHWRDLPPTVQRKFRLGTAPRDDAHAEIIARYRLIDDEPEDGG